MNMKHDSIPPRRIVSLVPSITETLCEFGLAKNLAAVTDYCVRPARALSGPPARWACTAKAFSTKLEN
jgi:ABC-type hemin transport system substrate-binding protein